MVYALIVLICVLMPAYAVWLAWTAGSGGRLAFALRIAAAVAFMAFVHLVARWDWLSLYLPWLWWIALAAAGARSAMRVFGSARSSATNRVALWMVAIDPVIAIGLFVYAGLAFFHPAPATDLSFPLKGGAFAVGQGGNSAATNYHNSNKSQRYALDIGAVDALGRRAEGVQPTDLAAYHIAGVPVLSPCEGDVVAAVDGIPDNAIGETNRNAPAGNHVVIACEGLEILLAHFRNGTVAPAVGASVAEGEQLGLAGNSGNSSEPHLHIHAVRAGTGGFAKGEPAPLTFDGVFPVRGTVIAG